jgi:membrane protease YdiL (CAAX protease family)
MTIADDKISPVPSRIPVALRAVVTGLMVGLTAANVWPLLLLTLGMPAAALAEALFLAAYIWWASGHGIPAAWREARRHAFRTRTLTGAEWVWSIATAFCFATTIHAALVVLFRLVPFPVEAFHRDYALGMPMSLGLKWVAIVIAAASAGICEETGFRGYMQQPIEARHGAPAAILISSVLFAVVHLSKSWAIPGMIPVAFGAGLLLGAIAWASQSLVPGIIAHTTMDIGMFAYWWTGVAGTFTAQTINVTGIDRPFEIACAVFAVALLATLMGIARLYTLARA